MKNFQSHFKIGIIFVGIMLFRLLPFRAPNLEPMMASIMPMGRKYGGVFAFLFAVSGMVLYDVLTNYGSWTWVTAITYGVVALVTPVYFKKFKATPANFAIFSFFATIFFDLVIGVLVAPFLGQSMMTALALQVPFTALHLAGNIGFALTLSPLINKWLLSPKLFTLQKEVVQDAGAVVSA